MHNPHRKRHGAHQKRTTHFLKVYKPFLPLLIITAGLLLIGSSVSRPKSPSVSSATKQQKVLPVLSYATNIDAAALLSATNSRRSTANVQNLSINSQLTSAAQAKANDMANRNYWAHNTPDGSPPWTFITNAGYSYSKAGENLACGFNQSTDVITGWYNSPSHKENLLLPDYQEIGFGIANADNYSCGDLAPSQQTIIVAMYGTPYKAQTSKTVQPTTTQTPQKTAYVEPLKTAAPEQPTDSHNVTLIVADTSGKPSVGTKVTIESTIQVGYTDKKGEVLFSNVASGKHKVTLEINGAKSTTDIELSSTTKDYKLSILAPELSANKIDQNLTNSPVVKPTTVNRIDVMFEKYAQLILILLVTAAVVGSTYVITKHSLAAHRFFVKGEQYVLTHKAVDAAIVFLCIALYFLTKSVGSIL